MSSTYAGKVALVTGGGSGIGRATSLAFAREGAKVVVADISPEGGLETLEMIKAGGGEGMFVATDVSDESQVVAMIDASIDAFGRIDCAFNNAGIGGGRRPVHDWELADFRKVIAINLEGVFLCMKYEIPVMLRQRGGSIVNNASIAGLRGSPTLGPYVASKHAVVGLTKTAALEYIAYGVRVNAICPGWTETAILKELQEDPKVMKRMIERIPLKRIGRPEEIAAAVLWLCSDAASFIVGHSMVLDGGMMA